MNHESAANRDSWGRWVLPALAVSILLHLLFLNWTRHIPVEPLNSDAKEPPSPPAFRVEQVEIDPLPPEPVQKEPPRTRVSPAATALPDDVFFQDKVVTAQPDAKQAPRLDTAILAEKPVIATSPAPGLSASDSLPAGPNAPFENILKEMPAVKSDPLASLPQPLAGSGSGRSLPTLPSNGKGFSNLDELLAQTGPLTAETAPILMPGDLLFEYDDYKLQPGAISSMQKLGQLLLRNPRSRFLIEGHSDSFGPDDYNLRLSELRAQTVKEWLISSMGIPADSIETRGFGKSRLIAPATGTIEEQKINRRVEIVIRPPSS